VHGPQYIDEVLAAARGQDAVSAIRGSAAHELRQRLTLYGCRALQSLLQHWSDRGHRHASARTYCSSNMFDRTAVEGERRMLVSALTT